MTRIGSPPPVRTTRPRTRAGIHPGKPTGQPARAVHTRFEAPRRAGFDSIKDGFATMESRFRPEKATGLHVRMQFVLTGTGGGEWFVVIKGGRCTVTSGRGKNPDTTLEASAADYLKISNGEMNKLVALLRGKLRVRGDMGKVRPFFACFRKR